MTNVGYATLDVVPSFSRFQNGLSRGLNPAMTSAGRVGGVQFGDAAGRSAGDRFGSVFRRGVKVALFGAAGASVLLARFGKGAVDAASDQTESINAVKVAYGEQASAVQRLGRQSAKSLALPRTEFNELAVRFSNFANTIAGGKGKKAVKALDTLTKRGADFASVYNIDVSEAATLFQSGLAGETEPLRRFGIDMSAAAVEAFAYANGIAEGGSKLTEAQKVQARYKILLEQTSKTQGDLANTSGSLANQQRFLNARWDDAKAKLGTALLPIVQQFTGYLLDHGVPAVERFADFFQDEGLPAIKDFGDAFKDAREKARPFVTDILEDAKGLFEKLAPFAKSVVDAFNRLPDGAKKALLIGGGLLALRKMLNGRGGPAGGAGVTLLGGVRDAATRNLGESIATKLFKKIAQPGSSPARPLYVVDISAGVGEGVLGSKSKVFGALLKGGLLAAFGIEAVEHTKLARKLFMDGVVGSQGGHGTPFGGNAPTTPLPPLQLPGIGASQAYIDRYNEFHDSLDDTKVKIFANKQAIEEFGESVRTRIPRVIETKFTLLGIDVANTQINGMFDTFIARNNRLQAQFPAGGEGGATQPPNHSGGGKGGGGTTPRTITVTNNYSVNDLKDAERRDIHKRQQVALGGFG